MPWSGRGDGRQRLGVAAATLLGLTASLLIASPALAGTVSITGSGSDKTVVFDAAPGEKNSIVVIPPGPNPTINLSDEYGVAVTAGPGCTQDTTPDIQAVTCPSDGVTSVVLNLGDGNDGVLGTGGSIPIIANGGPGDDGFDGGSEPDQFNGDDGNDTYSDGFSADIGAPDTFSGGAGEDTAYLALRSDALNISLDGVANDGAPGEDDNIEADVEDVTGGIGNDTITGSDAANHLNGWEGSDHVDGKGGDDVITDRACDADTILGGDGNDDLDGGGGAGDTIDGGPGDDTIHDLHNCTNLGDTLSGGSGTDLLVYGGAIDPLSITLDGVANDGVAGENDNVEPDIENVDGGSTPDYIQGDSADNVLNGEGNDDVIVGEGGNDTLQGSIGDDVLDGGPGADTLEGGDGEDAADYSTRAQAVNVSLDGIANDGEAGEGDNVQTDVEDIWGGSGNDVLTGNDSDNVLDGGAGADVFHGLGGEDLVDYSDRTQSVNASLDGVANDGEAGEGDNIGTDVEDLAGGSGDDVLTGNAADNVLDGGPGADQMFGGGGFDTVDYSTRTNPVHVDLDGSPGNDGEAGEGDTVGADVEAIIGGAGDDTLIGNAGDGALAGGDGNDLLIDPGGSDFVDGGDGDDVLQTRDEAPDEDSCGFGDDSVTADAVDTVTDDCETVNGVRQAGSGGGTGTGTPGSGGTPTPHPRPPRPIVRPRLPAPVNIVDRTAPHGSIKVTTGRRLSSLRAHGLRFTVSSDEGCSVHASLVATAIHPRRGRLAHRTVAHQTAVIENPGSRSFSVRLTSFGKRLLRHARSAALELRIVLMDAHGNHRTLRQTLRFR